MELPICVQMLQKFSTILENFNMFFKICQIFLISFPVLSKELLDIWPMFISQIGIIFTPESYMYQMLPISHQ